MKGEYFSLGGIDAIHPKCLYIKLFILIMFHSKKGQNLALK